jgi:hypothetical protein
MSQINWPENPTLNQVYTAPNGRQWRWNGYAWDLITGAGISDLLFNEVEIELSRENIERIWDGYLLVEGQENKLIDIDRVVIKSNITQGPFPFSTSSFGGGLPELEILIGNTTESGHIKSLNYTSPSGLNSGSLYTFQQTYYDEDIDDDVVVAEYTYIGNDVVIVDSDSDEKKWLESDGMWVRIVDGEIVDYFLIQRYVGFDIGDTITIPNGTLGGQATDIVFTIDELTDTFSTQFSGTRSKQQTPPILSNAITQNNTIVRYNSNEQIGGNANVAILTPSDLGKVGSSIYLAQQYNGMETDISNAAVTWRHYLRENGIDVMSGTLQIQVWYRLI